MKDVIPLAERLALDNIARLERAAEHRFATADLLRPQNGRQLAALYFYGYSSEMCLAAAYFRSDGFNSQTPIDRDTRQRRMAKARQLRSPDGEPIMTSDPHPLVGWARFLRWQRSASNNLSEQDAQRLNEAINKAQTVYNYWRPELRYKTLVITDSQLEIVRPAAKWILDNKSRF
jgi:hypothetical protein